MTAIPREAREGLLRVWLTVLSERHPGVTWVPSAANVDHAGAPTAGRK